MNKFLRYQQAGITLDQMREYNSIHGWDDESDDYFRPGGLAATNVVEQTPNFGGSWGAYGEKGEVVLFEGYLLENIYDGVLTEPVRIIARFSEEEWLTMLENGQADELDI